MTCTPPDLSIRSGHPRFTSARLVALSLLSVVLALGCGNDGSSGSGATNGNGATGGDGASSLLAVFYTIRSVDGQDTGYVNLTESLEGTLEIRDAVIEAPGNSTMYTSPETPNAFFIGSAEAPTITRYELSSDDTPIEVETVSFADFGLSRAPSFGLAPILTADRAYVVDLNIGQLIEWNPTEMTVGDAINLGDLVREGLAPVAPLTVLVDDETVYIPVGWLDFDTQRILPETLLLAVDTQTQEVHVHEDDRVIGIRGVYRTDSGEVFVASSDNFTAIFNRVGGEEAATAPGLLRVLDGERGYDPDFYVPLNDLAGGRPSQEVRPLPDGRLVFQSLHEDQAEPITPETSTFLDVCLLQAWRYYTIDQAEVEAPGASATEVTAWPFTNCRTSFIEFEERLFFVDQSEDLDSATLVDFSNPQEPLATVTVPGPSVFFRSVARMR